MNRAFAHSKLVREILAEFGAQRDILIALNETGCARYVGKKGEDYFVHYGFPSAKGGPDILCVLAPYGRLVCLEVKTGDADLTPEQRTAHKVLKEFGALVYVVRSVEDARSSFVDARRVVAA